MKIFYQLAKINPDSMKKFLKTRLPIYAVLLLVLIFMGVKTLMVVFGLSLFFFLGWITKGMFQAFHDWRLSQRLNRIHFSAVDYDTMTRENNLLHEALNAYKDNGKRVGVAGLRNDAQPPDMHAKLNTNQIRQMIQQMKEEQ